MASWFWGEIAEKMCKFQLSKILSLIDKIEWNNV